jgi:hypothetical protein
MAKRFTDTEIWDQDWYIDLPNKYKLFWNYIKDKCDSVGIWRPNKGMAQRIIGEPINLDEFLSFINIEKQRVLLLNSGRWFIRDFFIFQYGEKFSPTSPVHKGALKILLQNGIHPNEILKDSIGKLKELDLQQLKEIAYSKDINILSEAYGNPIQRVKDKDKDKDKYKGGVGENLKGIEFFENEFVKFSDGTIQILGKDQKALLEMGELKPKDITKGLIN